MESAKEMEKPEKVKKSYLAHLLVVTLVFACIYFIVHKPDLGGILTASLLANWYFTGIILLLMTIKLAAHLIRIKLIFWRIFLQTFLNTSSKIYAFFAHGYMVRLIAVLLAVGLAIKVYIFFCLLPVHTAQFFILYAGLMLFTLFKVNDIYGRDLSFLRSDVGEILKVYLTAFLLATLTGVCVPIWEIYHLEELQSLDVLQIMGMTTTLIDPENNEFLRILRVMIRHLYAYELLIQQLVHIPVFGKPLYFLYLVVSEGSVTFFSIFLLALPMTMGLGGKK